MDYPYPNEVTAAARARIKEREIRSGLQFEQKRPSARDSGELDRALRVSVMQVFSAFGEEALALGRQGAWDVDRVEREALEFLRRAVIAFYSEKGFDRAGHRLLGLIDGSGYILPQAQREFEQTAEWQQFQAGLLEISELHGRADLKLSGSSESESEAATEGNDQKMPVDAPPALVRKSSLKLKLKTDLIKEWMMGEGYTAKVLAQKLHVSARAVSSMRTNGRSHGQIAVRKLANLMNRDALDLYE